MRLVEALAVTLCGVGIGAVAHTISHVVDRDRGWTPAVDIPVWTVLSLELLWGRRGQLAAHPNLTQDDQACTYGRPIATCPRP